MIPRAFLVRHLAQSFVMVSLLVVADAACSAPTDDASGQAESDITGSETAPGHDAAYGDRIADAALRVDGQPSRDWCLAEVQNSLERAGVRAFPRLPGAVDLDNWMMRQGNGLRAWGFEKQSRDVGNIPRGSIIAWRPGQCGYHGTYGHIEIVVSDSRACSDYCGTIKRGCGAPNVYVPVGGGGVGGGGGCSVGDDKKLLCGNKAGTPMYAAPSFSSEVVNHMRSSHSWFDCWVRGERHPGGNDTWYASVGDDNASRGFIPAAELETTNDFDADPSKHGLPACPPAPR